MDRTVKWLKIGLFALYIALPLAAVSLLGSVAPYGRPFTPFPSLDSFLAVPDARAEFAHAVLERSILRKEAISAENAIIYYGFGYIDTPLIVSGKNGWLFLKAELGPGKCLDRSYFEEDLAFADALQDVAEAAGLRLVLSVSPDKATIYPEQLQRNARSYWACKTENAETWREIAKKEAPRIIDHAIPLLDEKRQAPDLRLFFATDTHWTPLGAALARRQLAAALAGESANDPPPVHLAEGYFTLETDLGNAMLLLSEPESVAPIDAKAEGEFAADFATRTNFGGTIVFHDSFYGTYMDFFRAIFPSAQFFRLNADPGLYQAPLAGSQTLIVNSVERGLFQRLEHVLSWTGAVGASILSRAEARAKQCEGFVPIEPIGEVSSDPQDLQQATATASAAGRVAGENSLIPISVPATSPDTLPCLSVTLNHGQPDVLEIFLPKKDSPAGVPEFEEGRSLRISVAAGTEEVRVVLPGYVAGRQVRVRAGAGILPGGTRALQSGTLHLGKSL